MLQASTLQPSRGLLKGIGNVAWHLPTRPAAQLEIQDESEDQRLSEGTERCHADFKNDVAFSRATHATKGGKHTHTHTARTSQLNPLDKKVQSIDINLDGRHVLLLLSLDKDKTKC